MLQRVFDLKSEIQSFMESKGKPVVEFSDNEWMCDFAFLVDITSHVNELNTRLQGKDQLICTMYDHVKSFQVKLKLWEAQLKVNNYALFEHLQKCSVGDSHKYVNLISTLTD